MPKPSRLKKRQVNKGGYLINIVDFASRGRRVTGQRDGLSKKVFFDCLFPQVEGDIDDCPGVTLLVAIIDQSKSQDYRALVMEQILPEVGWYKLR